MHSRRAFLAVAAAVAAPGFARAAQPVTVFAAASLQESLTAAGAAWTARSGTPVTFSFGASSAIARQIDQGAPADVFLSADDEWMDWLAGRNGIVPATRRRLLSNQLVLIAPAGSKAALKIGPGMALARALGGGRLAVADPASVPAGKYAKASLTRLGIWGTVESRLLPGENVRAALAYVARGEAPLGIVYATDARAEPKVRVVGVLPASSHPPIVYPAAVMARSRNSGAASFLGFLQEPQATAIFRRYGFGVLARPG
ncbi:MAG: molybdate ABC transporter substrate-binding protein [Caulobacterales bacterium]|nr:molybdate ABC transporter substrate-binding protein [Caulobacterales bacterium]